MNEEKKCANCLHRLDFLHKESPHQKCKGCINHCNWEPLLNIPEPTITPSIDPSTTIFIYPYILMRLIALYDRYIELSLSLPLIKGSEDEISTMEEFLNHIVTRGINQYSQDMDIFEKRLGIKK